MPAITPTSIPGRTNRQHHRASVGMKPRRQPVQQFEDCPNDRAPARTIQGARRAHGAVDDAALHARESSRNRGSRLGCWISASPRTGLETPAWLSRYSSGRFHGRIMPTAWRAALGAALRGLPRGPFFSSLWRRTVVVHGALTEDTQTFRANVIRPAGARFRMSAACTAGLVTADWIAGFPTATLSRMTFSPAAAAI